MIIDLSHKQTWLVYHNETQILALVVDLFCLAALQYMKQMNESGFLFYWPMFDYCLTTFQIHIYGSFLLVSHPRFLLFRPFFLRKRLHNIRVCLKKASVQDLLECKTNMSLGQGGKCLFLQSKLHCGLTSLLTVVSMVVDNVFGLLMLQFGYV